MTIVTTDGNMTIETDSILIGHHLERLKWEASHCKSSKVEIAD